jgi:hypothetical protein
MLSQHIPQEVGGAIQIDSDMIAKHSRLIG